MYTAGALYWTLYMTPIGYTIYTELDVLVCMCSITSMNIACCTVLTFERWSPRDNISKNVSLNLLHLNITDIRTLSAMILDINTISEQTIYGYSNNFEYFQFT